MKKERKIYCPFCGAQFSIYEDETQQRLKTMINTGIEVDGMFAMDLLKEEDAKAVKNSVALNDDEVVETLINEGAIPNRKLFRRWVMAQMFRLLANEDCMSRQIRSFGYEYQWKMLIQELWAQARMFAHNDIALYEERAIWFNREVAYVMAMDYIKQLRKYITHLPQKTCKKVPYVRFAGKNIFIKDLESKVFSHLVLKAKKIMQATTIHELLSAVTVFNSARFKIKKGCLKQCRAWISAYKGAGGYYTLQNMIRFHGCRIYSGDNKLSKQESLDYIVIKANEYKRDGWRMIGILKQCLKDNNINVSQKIAEWRKNK